MPWEGWFTLALPLRQPRSQNFSPSILLTAAATMPWFNSRSARRRRRLVDILAMAGIRSLVLKGVAVAHMLYQPHTSWRFSSDIDILVAPQTFREADHLLLTHGYRREWPAGDLPKRGHDMLFYLDAAITYVHAECGLIVELHHRLTANPFWLRASFDEALTESKEIKLPGGAIRTLDGALLIGYLAWHAVAHLEYRLKWFSDLARALLQTDRARLVRVASSLRKTRSWQGTTVIVSHCWNFV